MELLNPTIAYSALMDFLGAGGNVLVAIMVVTFFMWALIIERLMYWSGAHTGVAKRAQRAWAARSDHKSWYAHAIRDRLISETTQEASRFNNVIRALVAVTPLLGLLGTVTGMIDVFRQITNFANPENSELARGISEALVTTKFGLITAIPALVIHALLNRRLQGMISKMEGFSARLVHLKKENPSSLVQDKKNESAD